MTCAILSVIFASTAMYRVFAATAGNTGPSPGVQSYTTSNDNTANPKYVLVRSPNTGDMSSMEIPLYYNSESAPAHDFTLAINNVLCGNQSSCGGTAPNTRRSDPGNNQYLEVNVRTGSRTQMLGRVRGGTVTIPHSAFVLHQETQTYRAVLILELRNGNNGSSPTNVWRNRISFRLAITNPTANAYIGNAVGNSTSYVNLIAASPNESPAKSYGYKINFATPCTVTQPTQQTIQLYDLDNNNADNSEMNVSVSVKRADGTAVPIETSGHRGDTDTYRIKMTFEVGGKYVLIVNGISSINMVQYKLPFDSINSERLCQPPHTETEPACYGSTLPTLANINEALTFTTSVKPGEGYAADMKVKMNITGPHATNYGEVGYTHSGSGSGTVLTTTSQGFTPTASGTYTLHWVYSRNSVTKDCHADLQVGVQPYFTVRGGDIASDGDILAYNRNSDGFEGAGAQLAALATSNISSFITGSDSIGITHPGSRLAFSNYDAILGGDVYGGGFEALPDRGIPKTNPPSAVYNDIYLNNMETGTYTLKNGGKIWGAVQASQSITIIAQGDVYISDKISYTYNTVSQIPHLAVVAANGNIMVDRSVAEIHGTFYAAGNNKGQFYSCALGAIQPIDYSSLKDHVADCSKKLDVYGMVSASKLILARTNGGWASASPAPAEEFHQGPESWLTAGTGSKKYDSYISLPPVL